MMQTIAIDRAHLFIKYNYDTNLDHNSKTDQMNYQIVLDYYTLSDLHEIARNFD